MPRLVTALYPRPSIAAVLVCTALAGCAAELSVPEDDARDGLGVADTSGGSESERDAGTRQLSFTVTAPDVARLPMEEEGVATDNLPATDDAADEPSATDPNETPSSDDAAEAAADESPAVTAEASECAHARRLWFDDFETGSYARWTSQGYVSTLNAGGCFSSGISSERAHTGTHSSRTSIACTQANNHRIYGGMQFSGDTPLTSYTNSGAGIDAPHGIVVTYFSWLDAPTFGDGRWMSLFTSNNSCDWSDRVVTVGLEDSSNRLMPAHITTTGGAVTYAPTHAALPMREWVRTTVYLNYHSGQMQVWQDGQEQMQATFRRNSNQICQFHWGLYASGSSNNITLFEDDFAVWKLDQPLTDLTTEPWLGETKPVCP